jgi:hypothetical protein
MNINQLAIKLSKVKEVAPLIYLKCFPEILDYSNKNFKFTISIFLQDETLIDIDVEKENILFVISLLRNSILIPGITLVAWNIKNLFTFVKSFTNSDLSYECQLIDLKIVESYLDIKVESPNSYSEYTKRLKTVLKDEYWLKLKEIHRKIHIPLITEVMPIIESTGVFNSKTRKLLHPFYEIEGQANGRLLCHKAFDFCFNPHTLTFEDKQVFYPRTPNSVFINFDFRHMEVSVLQWLTEDIKLKELLEESEDFYKLLYKLMSGQDCDEKKRDLCKNIFLPVVYGLQAKGLAEKIGISIETAEKIIKRLYSLFPQAFNWIETHQKLVDNSCRDLYGRRRIFEDRGYRARNFLVQSPAALICLEKLVRLYNAIKGQGKLVCHIHDGYVVSAEKTNHKIVIALATSVLEEESELFPELRLKVNYKVSENLGGLNAI